jgi:TonB family protein
VRAVLALALLALPAAAEAPPLTGRDVASRQTVDVSRFIPRMERPGRVDLLCTIAPDGALTDCQVQLESPRRKGLAAATLRIAAVTRVAPQTDDGRPTAGRKFLFAMRYGVGGPVRP